MASVKLYLDTRNRLKDQTYPLKLSVCHQRQTKLIPLEISIRPEQWCGDKIVEHAKERQLNSYLRQRLVNAEDTLLDLKRTGKLKLLSATDLKKIIENYGVEKVDEPEPIRGYLVRDHFERFIGLKNNKSTKELYQYTLNKIGDCANLDELCFEDITVGWLKEFEMEMSLTCSVNTRSIHFRNLRAVFNDAIDEDLISQNVYPFKKFRIKSQETEKRNLSLKELRLLKDCTCKPHQEKYRDIFMLMFYLIGINAVDLLHLKEIKDGRIRYRRRKTGKLYNVKLPNEALEIFERYRGENYLLNVMDSYTNYKDFVHRMNENLKEIGEMRVVNGEMVQIPLNPELTTYFARHTWATLAGELDIPKETIAAGLGHGGNTTTDIYINFDLKKVDMANQKVINYVVRGKRRNVK